MYIKTDRCPSLPTAEALPLNRRHTHWRHGIDSACRCIYCDDDTTFWRWMRATDGCTVTGLHWLNHECIHSHHYECRHRPDIIYFPWAGSVEQRWPYRNGNPNGNGNKTPACEYIGWSDVTESMVTIRSPFCGYHTIYCVKRRRFIVLLK